MLDRVPNHFLVVHVGLRGDLSANLANYTTKNLLKKTKDKN